MNNQDGHGRVSPKVWNWVGIVHMPDEQTHENPTPLVPGGPPSQICSSLPLTYAFVLES